MAQHLLLIAAAAFSVLTVTQLVMSNSITEIQLFFYNSILYSLFSHRHTDVVKRHM